MLMFFFAGLLLVFLPFFCKSRRSGLLEAFGFAAVLIMALCGFAVTTVRLLA